ncbi:MAG TPA: LLM class F420-dependent oxidoreductase [Candidatus Binataceae bacterium]|nr:LLM class F420-dependent oxidoreductase [Candidatus Binataceae bacterium]
MKIGISGIGMGKGSRPGTLRLVAAHAERLGFNTLWAPEHVVLFDHYESHYPYSDDGSFLAASTVDLTDPFVTLSYVAASTTRIRLATGICLVPEHNPLVLAKQIATLDALSGGRFALGVGIGWSWEEFAALGIPFERRAQRTCEYIEVMRKLWGEEKTSFAGEFVTFKDARCFPKPAQGARVPIIFGGESTPALRRVARYGTGWFSVKLTPDQLATKLAQLQTLLAENNRKLADIELIVSPYDAAVSREQLRRYAELGVNEIIPFVRMPSDERQIPAHLEQIAREWIEPAATLG